MSTRIMPLVVAFGAVSFSMNTARATLPVATITAEGNLSGTGFGLAFDTSGNDLIVGASGFGADGRGKVFIFERIGLSWIERSSIQGLEIGFGSAFGKSVSIDGDLLVVGSPYSDPLSLDRGFAYVFRRVNGVWIQEQQLESPGSRDADQFGRSVVVTGNTVLVGTGETDAIAGGGAVYVFRQEAGVWIVHTRFTASDTVPGDEFGISLAIDGERLVVGAHGDDDGGSNSGSAYVFLRDDAGTPGDPSDDTWNEEAKLTASDPAADDFFGERVAIRGDLVAAGARRSDDAGSQSGSAYVFRNTMLGWQQEAKLTASDAATGDQFGWSVAIGHNVVVVGSPLHDETGNASGSAYVFRHDSTTWIEEAKLRGPIGVTTFFLGVSCSIDRGVVLASIEGAILAYSLDTVFPVVPAASSFALGFMVLLLATGAVVILRSRRARTAACASCVVLACAIIPQAARGQNDAFAAPHHPTHLLVRFRPGVADEARTLSHASAANPIDPLHLWNTCACASANSAVGDREDRVLGANGLRIAADHA